jgi:mono/diheme cytochrome c family protein
MRRIGSFFFVCGALVFGLGARVAVSAQAPAPPPPQLKLDTGQEIFAAACAGCHGPGGEGQPVSTLGFEPPVTYPIFTDCNASARERR